MAPVAYPCYNSQRQSLYLYHVVYIPALWDSHLMSSIMPTHFLTATEPPLLRGQVTCTKCHICLRLAGQRTCVWHPSCCFKWQRQISHLLINIWIHTMYHVMLWLAIIVYPKDRIDQLALVLTEYTKILDHIWYWVGKGVVWKEGVTVRIGWRGVGWGGLG